MRKYVNLIRTVVPNFKHEGVSADWIRVGDRPGKKVKYLWSSPFLDKEQLEKIRDKLTDKGYYVQHISDEIGRGLVIKLAEK